MKEEEDVRSERRRELLPLSIHRKRKTTTEFWRDSCSCVFFVGLFRREILRNFSSFPAKRLNFFFPRLNTAVILFTRERTSSLRRRVQRTTTTCDDHERICSFFEQSQQNKNKGKEVLFLLSFSVVLKECSSIS